MDVCHKLTLIKRVWLCFLMIIDELLLGGPSFRDPKLDLSVKRILACILLCICSLQLGICARSATVI